MMYYKTEYSVGFVFYMLSVRGTCYNTGCWRKESTDIGWCEYVIE